MTKKNYKDKYKDKDDDKDKDKDKDFGQRLEEAKPDQRAKTKTMTNTCEIEV